MALCPAASAAAASVRTLSRRGTRNSAITEMPKRSREGELRQQGDGAFTDAAQVAAHADHAVKGNVHERAAVEAMTGQRLFGLALRAVARAVTVGIGDLFGVLCDGAGEWV